MGKTRAECSQNAYTSAFLSHWIQILANSSPKSDIKKIKKTTLFFHILRSVGRGQHNNFFFWPNCEASLRLRKFRTCQLGLLVECCAVEGLKEKWWHIILSLIDKYAHPMHSHTFFFLFCMLVESIIIIAQSCLPQSHSALKYWHPHLTRMMYN